MSGLEEQPQEKRSRSARGVLCAKCEHLNAPGRGTCTRCGAHLFVSCHDCGETNERTRSRCSSCGRRLHRGFVEKLAKRVFKQSKDVTPLQIFLFVLALGVVFGLIVLVSTVSLPKLW